MMGEHRARWQVTWTDGMLGHVTGTSRRDPRGQTLRPDGMPEHYDRRAN